MIIILIISSIVSAIVSNMQGENDYIDSIIIITIVILNAIMGLVQEAKAEKSIESLKKMTPQISKVLRNSKVQEVDANELVPGDIIILEAGNYVPADCRLIESFNLKIEESSLTGETEPVEKITNKLKQSNVPIGDMKNMAFMATVVVNGHAKAVVTETGMNTKVGKIANMIIEDEAPETPIQRKLAQVGKVLGTTCLVICGVIFIIGLLKNIEPVEMFMTSVGLAVAAIPEGLPAIVTIVLSIGVTKMAKKNSIIRKLPAVETLGSSSVICSDKTGTLTKGAFEVSAVHHNELEEEKLLEYAALAECASSHPISKSLQKAYGKEIDRNRVSDIREISGHGITAVVDGHEVAAGNDKLMKKLGLKYHECHTAGTIIHMAIDKKYAGHIVISDVVKEHSKEAVAELKKAGIKKTVMLTGDSRKAAEQTAKTLGIDQVYSELLPGDKVQKVEELLLEKEGKEKLVFVGDGINDAPVLTRADIGIAMGAMGSDAAIEAADVVLMDDDPLKISKAIKISQKCLRIVYQNIIFALAIKFACLGLGALGIANMWFAIFADVGVMIIAVLNAVRALRVQNL